MTEVPMTPVRIDPDRAYKPQDRSEELALTALDTAWALLREYAARVVFQPVLDANPNIPTDDAGLFATMLDDPDAPRSFAELGADPEDGRRLLSEVFALLIAETADLAETGLDLLKKERDL